MVDFLKISRGIFLKKFRPGGVYQKYPPTPLIPDVCIKASFNLQFYRYVKKYRLAPPQSIITLISKRSNHDKNDSFVATLFPDMITMEYSSSIGVNIYCDKFILMNLEIETIFRKMSGYEI